MLQRIAYLDVLGDEKKTFVRKAAKKGKGRDFFVRWDQPKVVRAPLHHYSPFASVSASVSAYSDRLLHEPKRLHPQRERADSMCPETITSSLNSLTSNNGFLSVASLS